MSFEPDYDGKLVLDQSLPDADLYALVKEDNALFFFGEGSWAEMMSVADAILAHASVSFKRIACRCHIEYKDGGSSHDVAKASVEIWSPRNSGPETYIVPMIRAAEWAQEMKAAGERLVNARDDSELDPALRAAALDIAKAKQRGAPVDGLIDKLVELTRSLQVLNVGDVRQAIREVERVSSEGDHERAHGLEDQLYKDVLRSIAIDPSNAQAIAAEALSCETLEYPRHCS